jgi:hypothetical protein
MDPIDELMQRTRNGLRSAGAALGIDLSQEVSLFRMARRILASGKLRNGKVYDLCISLCAISDHSKNN